jgi:hypothetical protein
LSALRSTTSTVSPTNSDDLIARQHNQQEQLSEQFLAITRALKNNVTVAGHVIREDNQVRE